MQKQKFSFRGRARSFRHAFVGIWKFIRIEHNARIHLVATLLVLLAALILKVTSGEAIGLVMAVGLVWVAEMINCAVEKLSDFISTERRPEIGLIKDVAAGAVLVAAFVAFLIGVLVFLPKIW